MSSFFSTKICKRIFEISKRIFLKKTPLSDTVFRGISITLFQIVHDQNLFLHLQALKKFNFGVHSKKT